MSFPAFDCRLVLDAIPPEHLGTVQRRIGIRQQYGRAQIGEDVTPLVQARMTCDFHCTTAILEKSEVPVAGVMPGWG